MTEDRTGDHPCNLENPFLAQWLETTRSYLFAYRQPSATGELDREAPPAAPAESRGAQTRGIARVPGGRGRLHDLAFRNRIACLAGRQAGDWRRGVGRDYRRSRERQRGEDGGGRSERHHQHALVLPA